jgi:hypothetical protein
MRKVNLKIPAAVCVLMMTVMGRVAAVTHYISPGQSIQTAIDAASNGDEIEAAPGTYNEAINFKGKAVRLYSSSGPEVTIIDANGIAGAYHVVQCVSGEDANTIMEGFTITGGNANGPDPNDKCGGGMLNYDNSSPTVTDCVFTGNSAAVDGGAMHNSSSNPTVSKCIFIGNSAGRNGAGIFNLNSSPTVNICSFIGNNAGNVGGGMSSWVSSPKVTDCTFTTNSADQAGGGMSNWDSSPTVTDCNFTDNVASVDGGGMFNYGGSSTILDCTFSGNSADYGGGMYNKYTYTTVTNCNFTGNRALSDLDGCGGGMYNYSSSPTVTNCTFSGNSANGIFSGKGGGGMYNFYYSSPIVTNCILWGNTALNGPQIYGGSPTVTYSDVQGGWSGTGGNNIDADPCFADANNLRLLYDSPCVDAGDNSAPNLQATDLSGDARVVDGDGDGSPVVDMGAYEFQSWLVHNITQDLWYETIQPAIDEANDGDQIKVAAGTYYGAVNFKGKAVRLYSSGGPDVTTIDANGAYHVVRCISGEGPDTILEGFTITGGNANGTSPDNRGGGMYCESSSPTVTGCTFSGNSAADGGGVCNSSSSSPTMTNCTFGDNSAQYDGGGIYNKNYSNPKLTNCIISNNSASYGGGMCNHDNSNPTISNCTLSNNSANNYGGGIINNSGSSPTVTNCILWYNLPDQINDWDFPGSSTTVTYSDVQGGWGDPNGPNYTNIDANPSFMDPHNSDPNLRNLRLKPDSPCIDAGDSTVVLAISAVYDLDGKDRYFDIDTIDDTGSGLFEFLDMGAYEFNCNYTIGDINCDSVVNFKDIATLASNWLSGT